MFQQSCIAFKHEAHPVAEVALVVKEQGDELVLVARRRHPLCDLLCMQDLSVARTVKCRLSDTTSTFNSKAASGLGSLLMSCTHLQGGVQGALLANRDGREARVTPDRLCVPVP